MSIEILVNGKAINSSIFSGGEVSVCIKGIHITEKTVIYTNIENSNDLMGVFLVVDAIRCINLDSEIELIIPYFPYARQDRVCNPGESFSLKVITDMINNLNLGSVIILDPHSKILVDLLNNVKVISQETVLKIFGMDNLININKFVVVSPDEGSSTKIKSFIKDKGIDGIFCSKTRNPLTGEISNTHVPPIQIGKDVIIIDDICDGGRTFIELSRVLKEKGVRKIYLYVTHGIFSRGLDLLKDNIEHIYCYHTFDGRGSCNFLTVLKENIYEDESTHINRLLQS